MEGVVNGVFYCNKQRTQELSDRMFSRNLTAAPIKMQYEYQICSYTICSNAHPWTVINPLQYRVNKNQFIIQKLCLHLVHSLPFNGFQANVDVETRLHNTIFPLQACPQAKYFPGTSSDMYNSQVS